MGKKQITHAVYNERAKLLQPFFSITVTFGSVATLRCESTTGQMANILLDVVPTVSFISSCVSSQCSQEIKTSDNCYVSVKRPPAGLQDLEKSLEIYLSDAYTPCNEPIYETCDESAIYCNAIRHTKKSLVSGHLFVEVLDRNPEMILECRCSLLEVPKLLKLNSKTFFLRGVVAFRGLERTSRKSVGHYLGYVRRHATDTWQKHDDLRDKVEYATSQTNVRAHVFIYTI